MKSLKIFSQIKRLFSYGDRLRPNRDWFALLIVGALLLVGSLVWNAYLFTQLQNGKVIGSSAPVHTASTTSITAVQAVFKARAAEESNYQHSYSFIDPSL